MMYIKEENCDQSTSQSSTASTNGHSDQSDSIYMLQEHGSEQNPCKKHTFLNLMFNPQPGDTAYLDISGLPTSWTNGTFTFTQLPCKLGSPELSTEKTLKNQSLKSNSVLTAKLCDLLVIEVLFKLGSPEQTPNKTLCMNSAQDCHCILRSWNSDQLGIGHLALL